MANKKPNRTHAIHSSASNISDPSKLQFDLRDFPRVLVYGCGHLQKHTQFSFHVFSGAVYKFRTLAKYVNIIVQLIVSQRNKCERIKYVIMDSNGRESEKKNEAEKHIFIGSVSAVRSKLLFNCSQ